MRQIKELKVNSVLAGKTSADIRTRGGGEEDQDTKAAGGGEQGPWPRRLTPETGLMGAAGGRASSIAPREEPPGVETLRPWKGKGNTPTPCRRGPDPVVCVQLARAGVEDRVGRGTRPRPSSGGAAGARRGPATTSRRAVYSPHGCQRRYLRGLNIPVVSPFASLGWSF